MASPPESLSLSAESLASGGLQSIVRPLNTHAQAVAQALTGGLTFGENFNAEWVDLPLVTPPDPVWHLVGGTNEPAFKNSWVNYNVSWDPAAFRMEPGGMVRLKGLVKSGTPGGTSVIFTLPSGYRPALASNWAIDSNSAHGNLSLRNNGDVIAAAGSGTVFAMVSSFQALATCSPPEAWSGNGFPLAITLKKVRSPRGVFVARVAPRTPGELVGAAYPDWEPISTGIRIKALQGLSPGRQYAVTLLVVGG